MAPDMEYYRNVYRGTHGEEIIPFLKASSDTVECTVSGGTEGRIKYASCIEADYRCDRQYKSVKLGDYSYTSPESISMGILSPAARIYLEKWGMLCRCIDVD